MSNEISKVKQLSELKRKPATKRANLIDFAENTNVLALDLPLIWRSLAMKTSTRDGYSITEGKEISGLTYSEFRNKVENDLIHLDFTNNDWGTTDSDTIASWIKVCDYIVDYIPFVGQPVATEKETWDGVKSMFR